MKQKTRNIVHANELNGLHGGKLVGQNGELNAHSRQELMQQIAHLQQLASTGGMHITSDVEQAQIRAARRTMMTASFGNKNAHAELGEIMADDLYQTANRLGFARRFLTRQDLKQGEIPRVKMRMKNVTAVVVSAPTRVETQLIQDNLYTPPEFDIITRPFVPKREIDQSTTDVVDEKYIEATEALMVAEDRIWREAALRTVGIDHPLTNVPGSMTPSALRAVESQITNFNLPAQTLLIANDLWQDISTDAEWGSIMDPVSKHEVLLTGRIGTLYGMDVISDAFRHEQHRVLERGEFWIVSSPEHHGAMTDRGGIESTPIDISTEGVAGRGWVLTESLSMVIANSRSVCRGVR